MKIKVIAFSNDHFAKTYLDSLTDVQLIECALEHPNTSFTYDYVSVKEFVQDLNDGVIDLKHNNLYTI